MSPSFELGLAALGAAKLPEKTSYQVAKKIIKIKKEQEVYNNLRNEKIKFFCAKNEDGSLVQSVNGNISVAKENIKEFTKEMDALLDVDVIGIDPVKHSELGEKHGLTPGDFVNLGEFIEES